MGVISLFGFFTSPDAGSLWWSIGWLAATVVLLALAGGSTRPPRMVASTTSAELGAESPAVASLLTNGFVVTPPAAVATLLDLVARGWLRIEHAEHEVVLLTDRRGREGDQLTGYEQQVLNHVHKLTAGTLTGVSGAGVEIAGLRLSRRWWRRFTKSVVTDARRQHLSRRRWTLWAIGPPIVTCALAGRSWWIAVRSGEETAVADSLVPRAIAAAVAILILLVAWRLWRRLRSRAQRPTTAGLQRAEHWLSVRAWMEPRGFEGASAAAANSASRALAYAAALGLAERAADELPIVPEDDRLAWSNATGEWHVVRVRYPFRPGYGRHPALMLLIGLAVGAGVVALQRYLLEIARGKPRSASSRTSPIRPTSSRPSRSSSPPCSSCRCCGWSGWRSPAPSICSRRSSARGSSCAPAVRNASSPSRGCCARWPGGTGSPSSSPWTTAAPTASVPGCRTNGRPSLRVPAPG